MKIGGKGIENTEINKKLDAWNWEPSAGNRALELDFVCCAQLQKWEFLGQDSGKGKKGK